MPITTIIVVSCVVAQASTSSPRIALKPVEVSNGEFKADETGAPEGWRVVGRDPGDRVVVVDPLPRRWLEWTDGVVLDLPADSGRTVVAQRFEPTAMPAGSRLRLGLNVRDEGDVSSAVECLLRDDQGRTLDRATAVPGSQDWSRRFVQLEVPADATPIHLELVLRNLASSKDASARIDRLSIARFEEDGPGFISLFNGVDLAGWTGSVEGFGVEMGSIRTYPERAGGNLFTESEFGDFTLRFAFQLEPGSNNGIAIRAPLQGDPAFDGLEVQVLENGDPKYEGLAPWQVHGSIYGIAPALRGYQASPGTWNHQEIVVDGRRVQVTLNGKRILEVDLDEATANGTASGRKHPGLQRRSGHIGFCGHGDVVRFRDLRVRPISGTSKPSSR